MSNIVVDYSNVMSNAVGPENGMTDSELSLRLKRGARIMDELQTERTTGGLAFLNLHRQEKEVADILTYVQDYVGAIENFVVLGIGGSALGACALHTALCHPFHNLLSKKQRNGSARLFVLDNIDPEETRGLFDILSAKNTIFNVITKSGETTETLATFLLALNMLKKGLGDKWKEHVVLTTDPEKGFLRQLARQEGLRSFSVPPAVGGRFSVLTPVGLLPAAAAGIDIKALLQGAAEMDKLCFAVPPKENPAYICAIINHTLDTVKDKNILATMPYSFALSDLAEWFRQLWAESLGKKFSLDKKVVHAGSTPVTAIGATDQHSQLQLFNEGPYDKLVVFLEIETFRHDLQIPALYSSSDETAFLGGKLLTQLLRAEKKGTELSLLGNRRPNYTIRFSDISPKTVGAFILLFELATAIAGKLYAVNTFDQPGVAESKEMTFALMGKKGYEARAERIVANVNGVGKSEFVVRCEISK